jgi:hypothetical protein
MSKVHKQLRHYFDGSESIMTGFQIGAARTYARKAPAWVMDNKQAQIVLLRAFPNLRNDQRQRHRAARWAQVITWYFHLGYTAKQIGEEMGVPRSTVVGIIRRIRLVARAWQSNGSGPRGGKRGRPRIIVCTNGGTSRKVCLEQAA